MKTLEKPLKQVAANPPNGVGGTGAQSESERGRGTRRKEKEREERERDRKRKRERERQKWTKTGGRSGLDVCKGRGWALGNHLVSHPHTHTHLRLGFHVPGKRRRPFRGAGRYEKNQGASSQLGRGQEE